MNFKNDMKNNEEIRIKCANAQKYRRVCSKLYKKGFSIL